MTKIKKGTALGYFMPGIIIVCVLSFFGLCLLCVPTYIYLSTITVAGLVHYFMFKRQEHPWGLNQDQIEDAKRISVCIVGSGFSGTDVTKHVCTWRLFPDRKFIKIFGMAVMPFLWRGVWFLPISILLSGT